MTNYNNQKTHLSRTLHYITASAKNIEEKIDRNYGIIGGYTESEMKKLNESILSIHNRLVKIRQGL